MPKSGQYQQKKAPSGSGLSVDIAVLKQKREELVKKYGHVTGLVPVTSPRPQIVESFTNPERIEVGELPNVGKFVVYVSGKKKDAAVVEKERLKREDGERIKREEAVRKEQEKERQATRGQLHIFDEDSRAATSKTAIPDPTAYPIDLAPMYNGRGTPGTFNAYNTHSGKTGGQERIVGEVESSHPGKYHAIMANEYNELTCDCVGWLFSSGGSKHCKHTEEFADSH